MPDGFWELCLQAPGLALLVIVVRMFLMYLRTRDGQHTATIKQISEDSKATHVRTVEALDRNTEMFGRVLVVVEHAEEKLQIKKEPPT